MVEFHAIALLMVALSPVTLWLMRRAHRRTTPPASIKNIVYALPFLIVGGILSAMLSINGTPTSEWVVPTFVIVAAAFIAPSPKSMRTFSIVLFFVCIALCIDGLWLRSSGYTSDPARTASYSAAISRTTLNSVRDKVQKQQWPPVDAPKPLSELVDQQIPNVECVHVVTEWHTPITGLFKINRDEQRIWVTGMNGAIPQLETRPL